jgi:hypothetical protein
VSGFRATLDDGSHEGQVMPPDRAAELAAAHARAAAVRDELAERHSALERVTNTLPRRPAWWAIWMWVIYWIRTWLIGRKRIEKRLAEVAHGEARARLDAVEQDVAALETHARLAKTGYVDALRRLASGGQAGTGVLEVDVTVATTQLTDGIEILELAGASRASAEVDAVFLAQGDRVFAPTRAHPLAIGSHAETIAALPLLLPSARALRLARRVQQKVTSAMVEVGNVIERKETAFRTRMDRLHAMRIQDPAGFSESQLSRVHGEISASITAVVEHASVHLGSELAQLQNEWIGSIAKAADSDALKAAMATIDDHWEAEPRRIAEEVRVLVMGGLGGCARDTYPSVVGALVSYGLSQEHARALRAAPELPPVVLLPSLNKEATKVEKSGWFAGLFRSFEARRAEIREKVHHRLQHMREVAEAELLDAEPRLHRAIRAALAGLLETAIAQQQLALDQALDEERAAITIEREAIAPLVRAHDAVREEARRLSEMVAELELQEPAISVAAAAAETASLSR